MKSNRLYVLIQFGIVGMGGGQMYIRNKKEYMQSEGWDVVVFSGVKGKIYINDLKNCKKTIIPAISSSALVYGSKYISKIISLMSEYSTGYAEVVIESGSLHSVFWGELLANKLRAKHIIFMLDERPDAYIPQSYLPYYEFKLKRRELAGITYDTLPLIFKDHRTLSAEENIRLSAASTNVVEDYESKVINKIPDKGINVGVFGRLDKEYIMAATEAIFKVASRHPDKFFNAIYIGGANSKKRLKAIKNKLKRRNVNVIFLGYLFPIPKKLFSKLSLCLSSSGSALVAYREGCFTITIDARDLKAIGVLNYTTSNTLYRDNEEAKEIDDVIENVLFGTITHSQIIERLSIDVNRDSLLAEHIQFMNSTEKEIAYFPLDTISVDGKDKKKKAIRKIIGNRLYVLLRPLYSKLFE